MRSSTTGTKTSLHKAGETGKYLQVGLSILCGICLAAGFALSFIDQLSGLVPLGLFLGAYIAGSYYAGKEALRELSRGRFDIDFLMLVAAAGAAILGKWSEGGLLLFLFSLGNALEQLALEKARKSIHALTELTPATALVKKDQELKEVPVETLETGDLIVVQPNTKIAADGIVISGTSSVNQAPITGESMPVEKTAIPQDYGPAGKTEARYLVFAGTINGNGVLEVRVTKRSTDSTVARLVKMVTEVQAQKSPTQQFTDRIEKYYVPIVLLLVVLLCFAFVVIDEPFSVSFYRAMSVLIGASPCALAISTPSAVLSGVARAARAGLLVKGGRPLEELGMLHAIAFDKTGTLTEGRPKVTGVFPLGGIEEQTLLSIVIAVESLSDHLLARAVVRGARERLGNMMIAEARNLRDLPGMGVSAEWGNDKIYAGNLALFEKLDTHTPSPELVREVQRLQEQGNTVMLIRSNERYIGIITLMDAPRADAKKMIIDLKELGISKMIMLTGDNQKVADAVAAQIGITDAQGGLLPEQKVKAITRLVEEQGRVAMVGDGVNDAPAMAGSTVGIAMGAAGSDVALETADVALLGDDLQLLSFAIGLGRKARTIIRQNLVISLGMVALLVPLTTLGIISLGPAVIGHEGSTVVVVLNALRLLGYHGVAGKPLNNKPA